MHTPPIFSPRAARRLGAFTLLELLIVIAVIILIVAIALPIFGSVQKTAKRTQTMSNMRQLGMGFTNYCGDHNGTLPKAGKDSPTWTSSSAPDEEDAWYNAVLKAASAKTLADFSNNPADFYKRESLFFAPAAKYPAAPEAKPYFAVSMNSKFYGSTLSDGTAVDNEAVRRQNISEPSKTVLFQESGLPDEKPIVKEQDTYDGRPSTYATRSVTRYGDKTLVLFVDGHADLLAGSGLVDAKTGKAYSPQNQGKVIWTMDPLSDANR